ncbi:acyl-CoA dehydrogenase domain-containing protein, partial [Mycolicibacterium fortuitum subsp. fortuitum DSM 46621 = ATCC 6841 = JCM 6387]
DPDGARYVRRAGEVIAVGHTLPLLNLRRVSRAIAGTEPGPEGNVTKLLVAEHSQHLTELGMDLVGSAGVTGATPKLTRAYLGNRAMTIAGGTSEITRNTIAERILGLPRDPLLINATSSSAPTGFDADELVALIDADPDGARYVRRAGEVIAVGHTLPLLNLRRVSRAIAGTEPGPEGNVTKLLVAEHSQHLTELGMDLVGSAGVTGATPKLTRAYLGNRAMTIAGGTSEITRNTIAERILGLPRDPLLK